MSRRKPALRIGGGGVVNRNTYGKDDTNRQGGLGLLGAYSDSDVEECTDQNKTQPEDKLDVVISNLDSKVADFLKEIDELESTNSNKPSGSADEKPVNVSWGNWTQCMDEKTQHPYYWNTVTNEVTWILPNEIAIQLQDVHQPVSERSESHYGVTKQQEELDERTSTDDGAASSGNREAEKVDSSVIHQRRPAVHDEAADIDIDAELEQALDSEKGDVPLFAVSEIDLEIELLRTGSLPLSNAEEEDFIQRFEEEMLVLEEEEENRRAAGTWLNYQKQIEKRKDEIMSDKMEWRSQRLPILNKMNQPDKKEKSQNESNEDRDKEDETNDMVISPVAPTVFSRGELIEESHEKLSQGSSPVRRETIEDPSETDQQTKAICIQCDIPLNQKMREDNSEETEALINRLLHNVSDKLSFLEISKRGLTDFHILLIEMEARVCDWKAKALCGSYLLKKLQEASRCLKKYEETATPSGWSCHWDSTAKRYFYKNEDSGQLQWQYPDGNDAPKASSNKKNDVPNHAVTGPTSMAGEDVTEKKKRKIPLLAESKDRTKRSRSESPSLAATQNNIEKSGQVDAATNIDRSSKSKDLQAPASGAQSLVGYPTGGQYSYLGYHGPSYMPYGGYQYGQHMFTPADPLPPPPPGEESAELLTGPPPLPSEHPPTPPSPPSDPGVEVDVSEPVGEDDGIVMELSEGELSDEKSDVESKTVAVMSQAVMYKSSEMVLDCMGQSSSSVPFVSSGFPQVSHAFSSAKKEDNSAAKPSIIKPTTAKRVKKSKKSSAVKKPPKEMTSLVAQWQKAKHQIEEENRKLEEEDEEEDRAEMAKRQIQKWKKEQISSGKALTNSNFEPIPEDWRSRILKKKTDG